MARHRLDGRDHLVVGDFLGGAGEGGVAAVGEDGDVAVGVAAQRRYELTPLRVVQRSKVHRSLPSEETVPKPLSMVRCPSSIVNCHSPNPSFSRPYPTVARPVPPIS